MKWRIQIYDLAIWTCSYKLLTSALLPWMCLHAVTKHRSPNPMCLCLTGVLSLLCTYTCATEVVMLYVWMSYLSACYLQSRKWYGSREYTLSDHTSVDNTMRLNWPPFCSWITGIFSSAVFIFFILFVVLWICLVARRSHNPLSLSGQSWHCCITEASKIIFKYNESTHLHVLSVNHQYWHT